MEGFIKISGHLRDADPAAGDGTGLIVQKNRVPISNLVITYGGNPTQMRFSDGLAPDQTVCGTCLDRVPVRVGDRIDFALSAAGSSRENDLTALSAQVVPVK